MKSRQGGAFWKLGNCPCTFRYAVESEYRPLPSAGHSATRRLDAIVVKIFGDLGFRVALLDEILEDLPDDCEADTSLSDHFKLFLP